jgi:hypothetical protein
MLRNRKKRQRGTAIIEAALCLSFFWLPLILGTYEVGFNLIRAIQVTQICRDAGHMYSQGTDFSLPMYQNLLATLMPNSFSLTSSGNTVVYLETLTYVDSAACSGVSNCTNQGKIVFTRAIPVGNSTLRKSNFGNPTSCPNMNANYSIPASVYLTNSCAVATGFSSLIPISASTQFAFMSEMFVRSSDYSIWSYLGPAGAYARSIF